MPPHKRKMRIVSLNSHWIIRKIVPDCTRKIELIGMKSKGIVVVFLDGGSKTTS